MQKDSEQVCKTIGIKKTAGLNKPCCFTKAPIQGYTYKATYDKERQRMELSRQDC